MVNITMEKYFVMTVEGCFKELVTKSKMMGFTRFNNKTIYIICMYFWIKKHILSTYISIICKNVP